MDGFSLVLSFEGLYPTDAEVHSFVHGVEFGGLWARMRSGDEAEIDGTFHAANQTAIERACTQQGWDLTVTATDIPEWINCKMAKRTAAKSNPHALRIIT